MLNTFLIQLFYLAQTPMSARTCIVRSAETVLEISDIIQFARLVFEYESYKGTMSSARQTGDDGAVASSRDTMPAELPQSMQTRIFFKDAFLSGECATAPQILCQ